MTDDQVARLERLLDRIERLGVSVEPLAATDTDGNPGAVAAGELIESAWGNAVADHVVKRYALGSRLPATKPLGALAVNTEPVAGRPPLVDMAYNNAWNVIWPRTASDSLYTAPLSGPLTSTEGQIGSITIAASPYTRIGMITAAAYTNGASPPVTSNIWELRIKANGTNLSRAQGVVALSLVVPPMYYTFNANTAYTITASAVVTLGPSPWTVISDLSLSRLDVYTWF